MKQKKALPAFVELRARKDQCPKCGRFHVVKAGMFYRKCDSKHIQRYRCKECLLKFSNSTGSEHAYEKSRRHNVLIWKLLVSNVSMRGIARILDVSRGLISRRVVSFSNIAASRHEEFLRGIPDGSILDFQFDEMETFHHSNWKPISIALAVTSETRKILGFRIASMPAKGKSAEKSRKKYGFRADERAEALRELLESFHTKIGSNAIGKSDKNPMYPGVFREVFETQIRATTKGLRGAVVGQGELKKKGFDPLFALNHTAAMYRAHIQRLARRTWCTTKCPIALTRHLMLYVHAHNAWFTK